MQEIGFKERNIRLIPGRLRCDVYGLKGNATFCRQIENTLMVPGINVVKACPLTGRVLVLYDESQLSAGQICHWIHQMEEKIFAYSNPVFCKPSNENTEILAEVAATAGIAEQSLDGGIPASFQAVVTEESPRPQEGPSPLLTASVLGLGALGMKQIWLGKTAMARSPGLFTASAGLAVLTGYPILKQGFETLSKQGKLNADLVLGTAAVALALLRENLLALGAAALIQYLHWQKNKNEEPNLDPSLYVTKKTKSYAKRATKWGFGLAGLSWLWTRSPWAALGVLLAANPRPIFASEEYAWKLAEHEEKKRGQWLPKNCTLCQISELEHVILADTSYVFKKSSPKLRCISSKEDEVWSIAKSLVDKREHPFKEEIEKVFLHMHKTKRTAFEVKQDEDGIHGKINGHSVCLGSKSYLLRHGVRVDQYELEAKRLQRNGKTVYFVGLQEECIGLIVDEAHPVPSPEYQYVQKLQQEYPGLQIHFLQDSLNVRKHFIQEKWHLLKSNHLRELQKQGRAYLMVGDDDPMASNDPDQPQISMQQLRDLPALLQKAKDIRTMTTQHRIWTMIWNTVGSGFAFSGRLAAPIVNLIADGLKLLLLSKSHKNYNQTNSSAACTGQASRASNWHSLTKQELWETLRTDPQRGLTDEAVQSIRRRVGSNRIEPAERTPWYLSFAKQFTEFTTVILLATAVISVLSGDVFDGLAMTAVLLINSCISTVQEGKAEKMVEALNHYQPPLCNVIRNGEIREVSAVDLVPGDIVPLEAGDRVPADLRILTDWNLEVNEAPLTGESAAVQKRAGISPAETGLSDRTNMLYMGTNITRGKVTGVVVQTGMNTEIGYLTSLIKDQKKEVTPLQEKVTSISKNFVKGAVVAGVVVLAVGLLRGNTLLQMVPTSVALIASAIPEGLPVTITIALSAGILRMSRRNAVVRKLSAIEALGRVNVICSDKTGTLTKNEMTVTKIQTTQHEWTITGEGYEPKGELQHVQQKQIQQDEEGKKLLHIAMLCNNSQLDNRQWSLKGDPTEGALLTLGYKAGMNQEHISQWSRKYEIPFDSFNGSMSVVCHDGMAENPCYLFSKGSVEAILKRCSHYQEDGSILDLTDDIRQKILNQNNEYAGQALRVLGFAYKSVESNETMEDVKEEGLIYVGMVGMIDPPKPEVEEAIAYAYRLGVKPVMITGDHPITAIAIAKQLGMYHEGERVITGAELNELTDDQLQKMVRKTSIFARVSPEHKLRIVETYQKQGFVVAMTGDGVNDAPAIKTADVGIAMGKTGTDVTKETADMVLKEDHFGSIVDGVKEGRTIISNIRKAIGCLLTGNLAEILVSSTAVLLGMPIPLVPVQILAMNLLTDALPATILAVNPGNKELVTERQEIVDSSLYKKVAVRGFILGMASLGLFASALRMGASLPVARTMAFASLVAGQFTQTFSWRQENGQKFSHWIKDKFLIGALGISWLALMSVIYIPSLAQIFHTAPLGIMQLVQVLIVGGSVSLLSRPILGLLDRKASVDQPVMRMAA